MGGGYQGLGNFMRAPTSPSSAKSAFHSSPFSMPPSSITAPTLKLQIDSRFTDYIAAGNESTALHLSSGSPLIQAIERLHDFFPNTLWQAEVRLTPHQAMLSMNAFMLYLSAVRMSLSGHVAATYPLFRTAVESACYAYLIGTDASLESIWENRHAGANERKLSRRKFSSAVSDAAKLIDAHSLPPGMGTWINEAYDSAIDFGAHPNPKSIFRHIDKPEDLGEHWSIPLVGLHDPEGSEASISLLACLDFGLVIAFILTHCVGGGIPRVAEELQNLSDLKNNLVREHFKDSREE